MYEKTLQSNDTGESAFTRPMWREFVMATHPSLADGIPVSRLLLLFDAHVLLVGWVFWMIGIDCLYMISS